MLNLLFSCLAISVVCLEVVGWMERSSILVTCREQQKALNSLVHQATASRSAKKRLKNVLEPASFIHLTQSFLILF